MTKEELNKEIIACLKEQQKEYRYGSDAYNVLRKLETFIPNIVNESQLKPQEGESAYKKEIKCKLCNDTGWVNETKCHGISHFYLTH